MDKLIVRRREDDRLNREYPVIKVSKDFYTLILDMQDFSKKSQKDVTQSIYEFLQGKVLFERW